ncbi:MAG TPA: DnaD domain protein [Lactobacillaceae bacterium]|jgi:DNA replication protein
MDWQNFLTAGHTSVSNLLLQRYRQLGMTNDDLALFLQIEALKNQGDVLPTPGLLARRLQVTEEVVTTRLRHLMQLKLLTLSTQSGVESYDWQGLYTQLVAGAAATNTPEIENDGAQARRSIFQSIEAEFGRPLSPLEMSTIGKWFDNEHYQPEMMLLALQEAVANGVRNLRYIERILLNWRQNNIQTPTAAQVAKQQRQGQTYMSEAAPQPNLTIPMDPIARQ